MKDQMETFEELWNKMTSEEKQEAMKKMMEEFSSGKQGETGNSFMSGMMGGKAGEKGFNPMEMMGKMMGNGNFNPMEMMSKMMGGEGKGEGFNPMEMCSRMMSVMQESRKVSTLATPEVQGLFEDWVEQIEEEVVEFIKDKKDFNVEQIAQQFKISKDSAYYFLTRLAQKGKVDLKFDEKVS